MSCIALLKTQDPMFETNLDYISESEEDGAFRSDDVSTKTPRESPCRKYDNPVDKLILIETQKTMDGKIFLIYSIQNSRNSNNFMIAQEMAEGDSDAWDCNRPQDCEVKTLSQVIDFIATLKNSKIRNNVDPPKERSNKKRKHNELEEKDLKRVREGIKQGTIHSWNISKGYGFVQEDETSENIFFHMSNLVHREWLPRKGERVEYKLHFNNKKMRETAVSVCAVCDYRQDRRDYADNIYEAACFPTQQWHNNTNKACEYKNARFLLLQMRYELTCML